MKNKIVLVAGLLTSLAGVSIAISQNLNINQFKLFADGPSTNAEYTIATWEYDGWCQNAGIDDYQENGRVFMFHSTSNGLDEGVKTREDIDLAVILIQRDDRDDVTENLQYNVQGNQPSILSNKTSKFENGDNNSPTWPANQLAIYNVRILVGNLTLDLEQEMLYKNEAPDNFEVKSIFVNTTLTYSNWSDDPAGNWERYDHEYPRLFTQDYTEIGDYDGTYPHTGIKIGQIMVTYGCSY